MKPKAQFFGVQALLSKINGGKRIARFQAGKPIFLQGDPSNALFYIESGEVKLTVVSKRGKEAVLAILEASNFVGEACLGGEVLRMANATALTDCCTIRLERASAIRALRDDPAFSEMFVAFLLARNNRIQEDLVDQLFNSSEKRLARVLLLLANFGKESRTDRVLAKISQETLAEMVGTTRPRVSHFMNKFRKLGFISYNGHLEVHSSLLNVVLHD